MNGREHRQGDHRQDAGARLSRHDLCGWPDTVRTGDIHQQFTGTRDWRKKVRGVRDEQSNAGVRLADALCGLIRDAEDGEPWAVATLARLRQRGVVTLV